MTTRKHDWKSILGYCFGSPENIFQSLTILCAAVAVILELFHVIDHPIVLPVILSLLVVIAANLLLDRRNREESITIIRDERKQIENLINRISNDINADSFFMSESSEKKLIETAEQEIIVIQETSRLMAETARKELIEFLKRGGRIRWITVADMSYITTLMSFRNDSLDHQEMLSRMRGGEEMIGILNREAHEHYFRFEVRYFSYPTDITGIFKDPYHNDKSKRKAIIRLQGFQVPFNEKLDFGVNDQFSPRVFSVFLNQFEKIWKNSYKCVLITGMPKSGKSSLLSEVVNELKERISSHSNREVLNVGGVITMELLGGDENRIGFEAVNVKNGSRRQIVERDGNGAFVLIAGAFKSFVLPILEDAINTCGVIIIDEIGPLQSTNEKYMKLVRSAFEKKDISIIGAIAKLESSPFTIFSKNYRTKLLEVNSSNRSEIKEVILQEFVDTKGRNLIADGLSK